MIGSIGVRVRDGARATTTTGMRKKRISVSRVAKRRLVSRRVVVDVGDSRPIAQSPPIDRWTRRAKKCRGGEEGTVWGCGTREGES